jgi:hypothetical protein
MLSRIGKWAPTVLASEMLKSLLFSMKLALGSL